MWFARPPPLFRPLPLPDPRTAYLRNRSQLVRGTLRAATKLPKSGSRVNRFVCVCVVVVGAGQWARRGAYIEYFH